MKQDKIRDFKNKERITKINFKQLMNQLIIRIMNHKKNKFK